MIVNGWDLHAYIDFSMTYDKLMARVQEIERKHPDDFQSHATTALLNTVKSYIYERIPADPGASQFRQGNTLGKENKHWFRAKFHQRYRLFYRYSTQRRVIVYAWMSSEETLRKAGAKTDPYSTFAAMLRGGHPPADFDELLRQSRQM